MAAAVLPMPSPLVADQGRSFKGEGDAVLLALIQASRKKDVTLQQLQERTLVPFFDSSESVDAHFEALSNRRSKPQASAAKQQHKRPAAAPSSPPRTAPAPAKQAQPTKPRDGRQSGSHSDSELTAPHRSKKAVMSVAVKVASPANPASPTSASRKHRRDPSTKHLPLLATDASPADARRQSPLRKRAERSSGSSTPVAASVPSKFAGPAFTNSPTPDCLPIPTSSLLMLEAADSFRSRLLL